MELCTINVFEIRCYLEKKSAKYNVCCITSVQLKNKQKKSS